MNKTFGLITLLTATLLLSACAKKENNTTSAQQEASAVVVEDTVSPEQQAAIDAIDQPILDEKNTDIPAEVANAPADAATPEMTEQAASEAVTQ